MWRGVLTFMAALSLSISAGAAAKAPKAPCAWDQGGPPCNPFVADSPYPTAHEDNYAQASTAVPGPAPGDEVQVRHRPLAGIPLGNIFSPAYEGGRRVVWAPGITAHQDSLMYKLDERDGRLIDVYHRTLDESSVPEQEPAISRVYGFIDRDNRLYRAAGAGIDVYGDGWPQDPDSPIRLVKRWQLPAQARCREDDVVVGVVARYDGRIAFVTNQGMVGVIARTLEDEDLIVTSINGARCADPAVPDDELETTTNSIVADERGGMYPLTKRAQYRYDLVDGRLVQTWRAPYEFGTAGGGGVRLDDGSGSTPTLMGTRPGDDRFVVITDGQPLMHLVLMWRDRIPDDWTGLPGRDRRIACEYPLTFGDPDREASQSEQSVVVSGYSSFVPNNELDPTVGTVTQRLPNDQAQMAGAAIAGQSPAHAPYGFERIDWDPDTRTCSTKWANTEVSIPNGVPFASRGSGLVYGIGQRDGVWGLEGMDIDTGESRLWAPSGPLPTENAFYSALSIGPDGSAWTGGLFGFTKFELSPTTPGPVG